MASDIGVGTIILMGTAAAPRSAANGGAGSDADLTEVTGSSGWVSQFNITTAQGVVDITKLDNTARAKQFISELIDNKVSMMYIENVVYANSFFARCSAIRSGIVHPGGRGKVDFKMLVGGSVTGNLMAVGTLIIAQLDLNNALNQAIGGPVNGQIDGVLTLSAQP